MENENIKKIKIFSKNTGKTGSLNCEYIIEGQITSQNFFEEENVFMPKEKVVNQFKKLVRIALRNHKTNIYKYRSLTDEIEILSDEVEGFAEGISEEYDFLENHIKVLDFKMTVKNDLLYEVLLSMEQTHRDIIYLSLCEDLNDREISEKLMMKRSNVQRIKQNMKRKIIDAMTGGTKNED